MVPSKISLCAYRSAEIRAEQPPNGGVVGFMSWTRLIETFRETREVNPNETIEAIVLEDNGLRIYYRDRTNG